MSDVSLPAHVARVQVASALHIVLQLTRFADGSRRVQTISEMRGLNERGEYDFQPLFQFRARGYDPDGRLRGELAWTGNQPSFSGEPAEMGLEGDIQLTAQLFDAAASSDRDSDKPTRQNGDGR
jgi:pilus assembly protein CpaF